MLVGAIADDLTGATDLGVMFTRGGLSAIQCVGVPNSADDLDDAQAVIIALKSRTVPAAEAVDLSLGALSFLRQQGATQYFFKYCSTFDSTDEGNIGPVTDALLHALGECRTIACPAMPENGRTVYQGHLFVGSMLLSESSMKDHPLTPMRDSNLVRVLGRQSRTQISLIPHSLVHGGGEALDQAFAMIEGIAVVDAINYQDLTQIGRAARDLKLITGGSGLGRGLAENLPSESKQKHSTRFNPDPGGAVVLAGSCSTATRRQVAAADRAGAPQLKLSPIAVSAGNMTIDMATDFVIRARGRFPPIIYSSAEPGEVAAAQQALGRSEAGAIVERFLAKVARELLDNGITRFVVAGGESSGAVTQALGATILRFGAEIDPGVPWTLFNSQGRTIALALKSGNFGADDFFLKAWDMLE